jgi:hypothetical protein
VIVLAIAHTWALGIFVVKNIFLLAIPKNYGIFLTQGYYQTQ